MGARGKKRRRADGSIAGRNPNQRSKASINQAFDLENFEPLEIVPTDLLLQALSIEHRHMPIDPAAYAALEERVGCLDRLMEQSVDEITAFADAHGIDDSALGTRAGKLADYLREVGRPELYSVAEDGTLSVDPDLLAFAAAGPSDHSNSPLAWSDEQRSPSSE